MSTSLHSASKWFILAGCIGAMSFAWNHLRADGEGAKPAERSKQLRHEQLAALEDIQRAAEQFHQEADPQGSFEDLVQARMAVLRARLALAETSEQRIAIHEQIVQQAESRYQAILQVGEIGDVSQYAVMLAKVQLMEHQIALEEERERAAGQ